MRKLNVVQKPQVMMKIPAALISEELREVLSSLKDDSVAYCIMHDNLILHYGQFLIDKQVDTEIYRYKSYLKKKLRQTADFLIALRKHSERPRAPLEIKDPYPLVQKYANKFDLTNPDAITSTNLRHQFTTQMQLVNSTPNELKWFADHLGHSLGINDMVYRDLDDMVELTKMSAALEVAERGELKQFKGKNFSEIKFDPMEVEPGDLDNIEETQFDESELNTEILESENESPPMKRRKTKEKGGRRKYDKELKSHALEYFKEIQEGGKVPDMKMCQEFLENIPNHLQGAAAGLSWKNEKNLIWKNSLKKKTTKPKNKKTEKEDYLEDS